MAAPGSHGALLHPSYGGSTVDEAPKDGAFPRVSIRFRKSLIEKSKWSIRFQEISEVLKSR